MKPRFTLVGASVLFCAICAGALAGVVEVPLTYEPYPDSQEKPQFRPWGHASLKPLYSPPPGEWKLPKAVSKRPVYMRVNIGEQERLLMLDESGWRAKFYDRAYFDGNGNQDLTDAPVLKASEVDAYSGDYYAAIFTDIDTTALIDGVAQPYRFSFRMNYREYQPVTWGAWFLSFFTRRNVWEQPDSSNQLYASLYPRCMYTAQFELNDVGYRLYLGDGDANGRFDDFGVFDQQMRDLGQLRIFASGDGFYLVRTDTEIGYDDRNVLGRYLNVSNRLYAVEIQQVGNRMTLTPVREQVARLELPMSPYRLSLIGEKVGVMACEPGTTVLAPPDTYRLFDYVLFREEPEGARWKLRASGSWESEEIIAAADGSTSLVLGEPYRPTVEVPDWSRQRFAKEFDAVNLDMIILGAGGEIVSGLECVDSAEESSFPMAAWGRPKEATYLVIKQDGEVAARGIFEYG